MKFTNSSGKDFSSFFFSLLALGSDHNFNCPFGQLHCEILVLTKNKEVLQIFMRFYKQLGFEQEIVLVLLGRGFIAFLADWLRWFN